MYVAVVAIGRVQNVRRMPPVAPCDLVQQVQAVVRFLMQFVVLVLWNAVLQELRVYLQETPRLTLQGLICVKIQQQKPTLRYPRHLASRVHPHLPMPP